MSFMGERGIQACLSRYCVGSSVTRVLIHLSRLLLQSVTVLCCQFLLLSLPPQGSVPAAVTVCHGVPQTDMWGAGYPRGDLEELSSTGLLHGLPGLHSVVLQRPDPHDTEGVPALLQPPHAARLVCPSSPDACSAPCSSQSSDALRPCGGSPLSPRTVSLGWPRVASSGRPDHGWGAAPLSPSLLTPHVLRLASGPATPWLPLPELGCAEQGFWVEQTFPFWGLCLIFRHPGPSFSSKGLDLRLERVGG